MSAFISQITVIAMVFIVLVVILSLFGFIQPKKKPDLFKQPDLKPGGGEGFFQEDRKTAIMSFWIMEQLNQEDKVVKTFEITNIPENGLVLGVGNDCDFQLEPYRYISHQHAVIGQDEKGMFIQDSDSKNGMYNSEQKRVKQLDIKDGLTVYLGNNKICFHAINPFKSVYKENMKKSEKNDFTTRVKRL